MQAGIRTQKMGKLRIYLKTADKIKSEQLLHKMFPESVARHMVMEAKKAGIMNASLFQTHFGYSNHAIMRQHSLESENGDLTICVELIDLREKLELFFKEHASALQGKVVIFKEVEFWDTE